MDKVPQQPWKVFLAKPPLPRIWNFLTVPYFFMVYLLMFQTQAPGILTIRHRYDKSILIARTDLLCNCVPDSIIPRSVKKILPTCETEREVTIFFSQNFSTWQHFCVVSWCSSVSNAGCPKKKICVLIFNIAFIPAKNVLSSEKKNLWNVWEFG